MEKLEFHSYKRPNGHDEFVEWVRGLPKKDRAKLLRMISQIEDNGLLPAQRLQWIKKVDVNLYEIRSKTGSNIQRALYFHVVRGEYLITHGFTKKSQKTPKRELQHAKDLRKEWYLNHENR
ncbi:type II toxin-antitoxin system RelE/ParE family toxin [Levilactobacillus yiduensis]|uniref:type II toxin-antitoxin system RelE/ParE family toxin n=1 Tax=Levilactobacillus yiduensis TaxID=2953880 RepID=UPI000EF3463A|nr:type II toxin-antitoxin system RelE/ParE family toxin [Levilactobacillus yiduensis]AYM01998.1 type II toxin-antitoxin system RelE/ParE family toxin [Levilactobacillus brevis]